MAACASRGWICWSGKVFSHWVQKEEFVLVWTWADQTFWCSQQAGRYRGFLPYSSAALGWQQLLTSWPPDWCLHSSDWYCLASRDGHLCLWTGLCTAGETALVYTTPIQQVYLVLSCRSLFKAGRIFFLPPVREGLFCISVSSYQEGCPSRCLKRLAIPPKGWEALLVIPLGHVSSGEGWCDCWPRASPWALFWVSTRSLDMFRSA